MSAAENNNTLLGRLLLWQKLALVVAALSVPAIVLGCFYFQQTSASVRQARSELEGTRFIRALGNLSGELLTHRSREYTFLSGDKARHNDVIAQEGEVDKQIEATDSIAAQLGEKLNVSQPWQALKAEWVSLRSNGLQQSPEDNDAAHAALDEHLQRIIEAISNRSMTSVDPDASTRALFNIASSHAPELMLDSSNMRRHAVRAASKGYLGGDDRMGVKIFRERQQAELQRLASALAQISPATRAPMEEAVNSAKATADEFYNTVQAKIINAANLEITGGAIYDAGVPTNRALKKISLISYDALSTAVEKRLARDNQYRLITGASVLFALSLALGLAVLITRSLATPLLQAISAFGRISAGHYESQIAVTGTDEANQVLRALESMQGKLRIQIETERAVAAENSRIRAALDKASTSVVLADAQHRIIYLNDKAQASFTHGASLEALAPEPARERLRLDALSGSEVEERALGNLIFRTVSSPVFDGEGKRIGTVMEWTERTQEVAVEKEVQTMLSAVLNGELATRLALEGKVGFFEAASRGINQLADNMAQIVALVKEASGEVYRASKEIASGNSNLQQRTEEQSASLEQTASSMEQMTTTVRQNADNAGEANQLAVAARDQAEQGGTVVNKAVHAMSDINESARKIADIIGVIDEIAFQTNLLALNAAVEAARAGEQGRGFAVVATEVRTLAGRSATAAKEIKALIQDSVQKVEDGSLYVTRSGQTLEQIVASVKKVSDIVAEIAAASREQSAGIGQVNRAVLQMDELTQQNAALVEQATTASQAMAHEAHALYELMGSYRLGDLARPAQASHTGSVSAPASQHQATDADSTEKETTTPMRVDARPTRAWNRASGNSQLAAAAVEEDSEWQEF
jgi:methyl-accepting chemotaxis protein